MSSTFGTVPCSYLAREYTATSSIGCFKCCKWAFFRVPSHMVFTLHLVLQYLHFRHIRYTCNDNRFYNDLLSILTYLNHTIHTIFLPEIHPQILRSFQYFPKHGTVWTVRAVFLSRNTNNTQDFRFCIIQIIIR